MNECRVTAVTPRLQGGNPFEVLRDSDGYHDSGHSRGQYRGGYGQTQRSGFPDSRQSYSSSGSTFRTNQDRQWSDRGGRAAQGGQSRAVEPVTMSDIAYVLSPVCCIIYSMSGESWLTIRPY